MTMRVVSCALAALLVSTVGCGEDDPAATPDAAVADGGVTCEATASPDAGVPSVDDISSCEPAETDYRPRDNGSADDDWAACISDDNTYHPFDVNISTIARVGGFESIADLLFTGCAPTPQQFTDARLIYLEDNGLDSRVSRREDEHYPPAMDDGAEVSCADITDAAVLEANADRCVGPARIQPLLNDAFAAGIAGEDPRLAAARIEAGLLWFLYVSVYKEATTCTTKVNDCDSSYAYYTGGEPRASGLGLARYVRELSEGVHDRVWDGILAVRCWRDLDNPGGEAENQTLGDQARGQLDVALDKALATIVRDRTAQLASETGADAAARWALLRILGPVLDRAATAADATAAATLRAEWARTDPAAVDTAAIIDALDTAFPCP